MKFYAFVEFETNALNRFGRETVTGYVTKSILKSNSRRNRRVKVICHNGVRYPRRKQIITIIPFAP